MSLLKFEEIIKESYFDFEKIIKNGEKYLAHLPKEVSLEKETLLSHSNLVLNYFLKLVKHNQIENNIDAVLFNVSDNVDFLNSVKLLYIKAIYWHDIGKINENFQLEKMGNSKFSKVDYGISSKHSILSAYLYLVSSFDYVNKTFSDRNQKLEIISIAINFAMSIWRHHTGIKKSINELIYDKDEGLPICSKLDIYVNILNLDITHQMHTHLMNNLVNGDLKKYLKNSENYFLLSKSLFSLLIISDYYATAQFMNYGNTQELKYKDFGLIDDNFRETIYKKFYENQFDKQLINKSNSDFKDFSELLEKSNDNLNHLRNKLFTEVRTNLRETIEKNKSQNLFYIEAPTGAGKTNLSLMSVVEILKNDTSINKVFYVFPFTTLITQTYASIKKTLELNDIQIVQLHSKAEYNQKIESEKDGIYGDEKANFLDNQFMNYPITLLSHVKFFDILTGISKDDNYIFHRLANSIVIIDEIQTYSPDFWSRIVYLLDMYAKNFNIKFIVMSATLPKIGKIIDSQFTFLVSNKQDYFQNPNFGKRVTIDTNVKAINKPEEIYQDLKNESMSYQNLETTKLKKVKTIIEFITKKGADEFYKHAKKVNEIFDEIFILSGTILEPRRKEIIDFIKNVHDKNILLVTTQVVEAGVDIDMDIGFKEKSLVDSDEQLAGRINRNSSKEGNKLFLFSISKGNDKFVYKTDKRKGISAIYQEDGKDKNVLETKDFDKFYSQILDKIIDNNDKTYIENLNTYINHLKNLRFNDSHINLIEMQSISVFVPINDDAVAIWELYEEAIQNKEQELIDKKISIKKLSGEISKYTFSLADYPNSGIQYLKDYGCEKYGYLYLKEWWNQKDDGTQLYTYEDGLDTNVLKGKFIDMIL
ncbi:CRISPR-associated helicase Cas3' [Aliarcobacter butzleri]|uniref:CRISPR-associated helicase Cas3' n=1 Tax=Aliarcobacter butzleri TaxID=28197 RepID=UPI0021B41133|nr:CRISPR-associated helicase Cas3' [Aliarcobacter butzleri]MCT7618318.1 CRISPR-associated helicase Cas3' [Aliarcobacter butzleri]